MRYFPFFFDLRRRRVLVVGGGVVAKRKADLLQRAGAVLRVVAPRVDSALAKLAEQTGGEARMKKFTAADLTNCVAAVSATENEKVNQQVAAAARKRKVPVNVVDCPALCDFIFPAIAERNPVVAAVSSGGASPVLARMLRAKLEEQMPPRLGALAEMFGEWRDAVAETLPVNLRREFWEQAANSPAAEAILAGDKTAAKNKMQKQLHNFANNAKQNREGEVYLIGAGPGDADLLTFRAHRLLQKADVVVYDRLVSSSVLDIARRDAEKIFAGKCRGLRAIAQDKINKLLIARAKNGEKVARLKGGDPFVFGRGGEEMAALRAAGVPYIVAPGVSAANGCAAAAQIPLTQRGVANGARFVTVRGNESAKFWRSLADDEDSTLVFYMAGAGVAGIAENLTAAGRDGQTPAALICAGATASQRVFTGMLNNVAAKAAGAAFSPALFIVGKVAAFAKDAQAAADDVDFPFATMRQTDGSLAERFANG